MAKKRQRKKRKPSIEDQLAQIQDVLMVNDDGTAVVDQGPGLFEDQPAPVVE